MQEREHHSYNKAASDFILVSWVSCGLSVQQSCLQAHQLDTALYVLFVFQSDSNTFTEPIFHSLGVLTAEWISDTEPGKWYVKSLSFLDSIYSCWSVHFICKF